MKSNTNQLFIILVVCLFCQINFVQVKAQNELIKKTNKNDIEAVKLLVASGDNLNQVQDMTGYTPLIIASMHGYTEIASLLIENGADLNVQDKIYGYTALMMACDNKRIEIAKLLIKNGADIHLKANNGATALIAACGTSLELAKLLLERGADIHSLSNNGSGVFTQCVMGILGEKTDTEMAEFLLSKGANIDEVNTTEYYKGYTPLFWAIKYNDEPLVVFLVKHGANVNQQAVKNTTPLSLAKESNNTTIIDFLEKNGAK